MNTPFKKVEYMWVKCSLCNADIERVKALANREFICYDCKREKQRKYDATNRRVIARKDHRVVKRIEFKVEPLTDQEQEAVERWTAKKHRRTTNRLMFRNSYNV